MPLNNFGIVTDNIFRSAQPDADGYRTLAAMGITSIFKLNDGDKQDEIQQCGKLGIKLGLFAIPTLINSVDHITTLAKWLNHQQEMDGITLVHCTHGRDRTGLVVGAYRILYQGWTVEQADAERKAYGVEGIIKVADIDMDFVLAEIWNRKHAA